MSEIDQKLKDFYVQQIADLKAALAGDTERGTRHVPHTGVVYVDTGEQILPPPDST